MTFKYVELMDDYIVTETGYAVYLCDTCADKTQAPKGNGSAIGVCFVSGCDIEATSEVVFEDRRFLIDTKSPDKVRKYYDYAPTIQASDYKEPKQIVEHTGFDASLFPKLSKKDVEPIVKHPFKYVELFAGIGGFRQALDALGGECVLASEIDPFATRAYKALYNGAKELHGDITAIAAADIPDHDVLVGGFPCQAFSVAGQRKGFEDTRGTLFFEIARIAAEKKPRLMLLENVKGLLSHDGGNTFETMCAALNEIGYAIDFRVLNSKHYGVPQNRERIFIVCDRDAEHAEWSIAPKANDVVTKAKRRAMALGIRTFNFDWPADNAVTTRLRDVLEANVDEKYYLSEEKTAKLIAQLNERGDSAEPIVHGSLNHYGNDQMNRVYSVEGIAPTITVVSGGGREQKIAEPIIEKVGHLPSDSGQTGAVYGMNGIAPTCLNQHGNAVTKVAELQEFSDGNGVAYCIDANYSKGTSPWDVGKGRRAHVLQGVEYSRKDGIGRELSQAHCLSASDWRGLNRNQAQTAVLEYRPITTYPQPEDCGYCGGSGTEEDMCEPCWAEMDARGDEEIRPVLTPDRAEKRQNGRGEEAFTLTAQDKHGIAIGTYPRYRIRKLTPLECWRLQGFPDAAHDTVKAAGISDSQRYKQAGNAVTVNVINAIGKRLIPLLNDNPSKDNGDKTEVYVNECA